MFDHEETQSLAVFAEKAYFDYAMYVILDRALPHLADGLKPVQRRIIYAMSELGLSQQAKHKKSARTVGDVIGKYHPHGDSACYEAMVLMAQPFSYRYPLIDGQGNWGSADDPKSFAAMRYTESRLTGYAKALLAELSQAAVPFTENFDGTLREPQCLPARLPNILLNGSTGIAVGMATHILPHNIKEVVRACCALLANPDLDEHELLRFIPAPDFPTGGELVSSAKELLTLYQSGRGAVRLRGRYHLEEGAIVIDELPYQISGSKIQEQIAKQMQAKKLPWLEDMRDESDHENPIRLVLVPRSGRVDTARLMQHLFATTDLEKRYTAQMNMIGLNGRPEVKSLKTILQEWLIFRQNCVRARLAHRLQAAEKRLHLLEGQEMVFAHLPEVMTIIREEDEAKAILMARYALSDTQAEMILNSKLRQLARLEEEKINREKAALLAEKNDLMATLEQPEKLTALIAKELQEEGEQYGDARRTVVIEREPAAALEENEWIPVEPVTLVLSTMNWIRGAKGHQIEGENLAYKNGDGFLLQLAGRSNQQACLLSEQGRAYSLSLHGLPSARGYGEPLSSHLQLPAHCHFVDAVTIEDGQYYLACSDNGYGFRVLGAELATKMRAGKALLTVSDGAKALRLFPLAAKAQDPEEYLFAISSEGRAALIPCAQMPELTKGKGSQIIGISKQMFASGVRLSHIALVPTGATIKITSGKQKMTIKPNDWTHFLAERGYRGYWLPKTYRRASKIEVIIDDTPAAPSEEK